MMFTKSMFAGLMLAALGTFGWAAPGHAAEDAKPAATADAKPAEGLTPIKEGDPVVAKVNGEDIKRSEVLTYITTLPDQVKQMPIQNIFPLAVDQVVINKVVGDKADKANLKDDPEVAKLVDQAKEQITRNVYVERQVKSKITDKKLKDAYSKFTGSYKSIEEVKARHMVFDTEAKAKDVIAKLDKGESFETLMKDNVKGGSPEQGGELGYFAKNEMIPDFANAAFDLKAGAYTKTPVKTQFGWHVIQVEDRRKRVPPKFDEVKPQLEMAVRQEILTDTVKEWEKDAKVQKFDINGDPIKEGAKPKG